MSHVDDPPPTMAGWNLALRFVLEIGALIGIGLGVWTLTVDAWRWLAVPLAVVGAATVWGVFNVPEDPSRSGRAPVEVSGVQRLVLELAVLAVGMAGLLVTVPGLGALGVCGVVLHYALGWSRVSWLMRSPQHEEASRG